jgi:acetoin utilization deacetylase AcuC-like enzyme
MNSFNFMKDTTEQAKQKLLASNWEQEQDADQNELAELNRQEYLEELKQLDEDNPTEDDYLRDVGMSRSDFL